MDIGDGGRGLGRAIAGAQADPLAGHLDGDLLDPLINVLAHRGPAIGHDQDAREEGFRQIAVLLEFRRNRRPRRRNGGVLGRRDFLEVSQHFRQPRGRRAAPVDIKCAAPVQHRVQDGVGAISVAPGQERDHHLRPLADLLEPLHIPDRADHLHHRCDVEVGIDDRLRLAGGAGCQHVFRDHVRREPVIGEVHRTGRRGREVVQRLAGHALGPVLAVENEPVAHPHAIEAALVFFAILDIDDRRRGKPVDMFQPGEILAERGIGRRDGDNRAARPHRGIHDERILDRIARQDHDRPVRPGARIEEALRQGANAGQRLAIGDRRPARL